MTKKKSDTVAFQVHGPPNLQDSWIRYYVQVWKESENLYSFLASRPGPSWVDQGYGHEDLADAVKQYSRLKEVYARVQIVERVNSNKVVIP